MTRRRGHTGRPPGADKRAADTRRELEQRRADDRTWQASHCVECWRAPEWCDECGCHVAAQSDSGVSAGQRVVESDTATTNGPGLQPETVLATPIRPNRKEGVGSW